MDYELTVVIFTITAGWKRWYVIRAYVTPNDQPKLHQVEQALARGLAGIDMLMVRNLNNRLAKTRDRSDEDLVTASNNYGL